MTSGTYWCHTFPKTTDCCMISRLLDRLNSIAASWSRWAETCFNCDWLLHSHHDNAVSTKQNTYLSTPVHSNLQTSQQQLKTGPNGNAWREGGRVECRRDNHLLIMMLLLLFAKFSIELVMRSISVPPNRNFRKLGISYLKMDR
jgi:hypothetical protein